MTGICGLVGREADDLESKAKTILSLMEDRGLKSRTFVQSLPDREKSRLESAIPPMLSRSVIQPYRWLLTEFSSATIKDTAILRQQVPAVSYSQLEPLPF